MLPSALSSDACSINREKQKQRVDTNQTGQIEIRLVYKEITLLYTEFRLVHREFGLMNGGFRQV